MRSPIPVVVISGGLGSGKTSLLNHVLDEGVGRVGVVINDFGAINVDALLVYGQVDATAAISGGCLCCLSDPSELDDILASLADPARDLDVILVEASGLAEPRELARMVVASEAPGVRFGGVVEVLDAAAWTGVDPETTSDRDLPVALDHLAVATLLVVNKTDLVPDGPDRDRLPSTFARYAPTTPVVATAHGRIDPALLFDAAERESPTGQLSFTDLLHELAAERRAARGHCDHGDGHEHGPSHPHSHENGLGHDDHHDDCSAHAHHRYASVSIESPLPVAPDRLVEVLEGRAPGVYRVKGVVRVDLVDGPAAYAVQAVGGWLGVEPHPGDADPATRLVAIGSGIDVSAVEAALRSCLDDSGGFADDRLHALTRYVRRTVI